MPMKQPYKKKAPAMMKSKQVKPLTRKKVMGKGKMKVKPIKNRKAK